jgi:hypothetical protein
MKNGLGKEISLIHQCHMLLWRWLHQCHMDHLLLLFILIHHEGGMVHGHNLYHIRHLVTLRMQHQEDQTTCKRLF